MHPGDCNAVLETHEFSQHFRARDHRNVLSTCSLDLGIVPCNRRTGHYNFRAGDVLYSVSDEDDGSKTGETLRYLRVAQVRTRDLIPQSKQHLGDAAHANAADANEVNALKFRKHREQVIGYRLQREQPSQLSCPLFPVPGKLSGHCCDVSDCIWMGKRASLCCHCDQSSRAAEELRNCIAKPWCGELGFGNKTCRARLFQRLSIFQLMVICCERKWNKDRRLPCRSDFCHSAGPGTAQQQIAFSKS